MNVRLDFLSSFCLFLCRFFVRQTRFSKWQIRSSTAIVTYFFPFFFSSCLDQVHHLSGRRIYDISTLDHSRDHLFSPTSLLLQVLSCCRNGSIMKYAFTRYTFFFLSFYPETLRMLRSKFFPLNHPADFFELSWMFLD